MKIFSNLITSKQVRTPNRGVILSPDNENLTRFSLEVKGLSDKEIVEKANSNRNLPSKGDIVLRDGKAEAYLPDNKKFLNNFRKEVFSWMVDPNSAHPSHQNPEDMENVNLSKKGSQNYTIVFYNEASHKKIDTSQYQSMVKTINSKFGKSAYAYLDDYPNMQVLVTDNLEEIEETVKPMLGI